MGVLTMTEEEPVRFIDQADMNGLGQIALDFIGWGTGFFDYDNDARQDLFVVNGSTFQERDDPTQLVAMSHLLFWNAGADRGFFEVGEVSGEAFGIENVGRGAAFADHDADGDVDVLVTVNGGRARLLRNEGGNALGWLRVVLRSPRSSSGAARRTEHATPTFAEGTVVSLAAGSVRQIRQVGGGPSYLSQSPPGEVMFGTGSAGAVDLLEVRWPSGLTQSFRDLPVRATIRIEEGGEPLITRGAGATADSRDRTRGFWRTFRLATRQRVKGDCGGAIPVYEEALALKPDHEDSLYYLGQCLRELEQWERAREVFVKLIGVNSKIARGHSALGALLASPRNDALWDPIVAERHLRRAHDLNAEETGPMVRIGELQIVRGDLAEAREWLEAATNTNHRSVEAAFLAGYLRWFEGDVRGARKFYDRARRAARPEQANHGVLGEGDRRPEPTADAREDGTRETAPPRRASSMGETLFGAYAHLVGQEGASPPSDDTSIDLDRVYAPVREFSRRLSERELSSSSGWPAEGAGAPEGNPRRKV
jgi:Flp pilus assembly protein TadD